MVADTAIEAQVLQMKLYTFVQSRPGRKRSFDFNLIPLIDVMLMNPLLPDLYCSETHTLPV